MNPVAYFLDTVVPEKINPLSHNFGGVLAYANGRFAWPAAQVERFLNAKKRVHKIDVDGTGWDIADVLDVERYDAVPAQVPGWVDKRLAKHSTAAIRCSESVVPQVVTELAGRRCYLIVASWSPSTPHTVPLKLPPGVVVAGVQYANTSLWDDTAIYSQAWLEGVRP